MSGRFHHGDAVRLTGPGYNIRGNVCATATALDGMTHYVRIKTAKEISFFIRESRVEPDLEDGALCGERHPTRLARCVMQPNHTGEQHAALGHGPPGGDRYWDLWPSS